MLRSKIVGIGSFLPQKVITNNDLAEYVDTSDEWIQGRTGIKQRHFADEGQLTSNLAIEATNKALQDAGLTGKDIDLIVLATSTPDRTFPATAVRVQHAIGMTAGAAFDVQAVCSGFVFALATADNFLRAGSAKRALVIGAETFSRILDFEDRTTCVLFGDGAGAIVLEATEVSDTQTEPCVLSTHLYSDGQHEENLYVDGGVSSTQTTGKLRMKGQEVFKHAVGNLAGSIVSAVDKNNLTVDDVDWFVPHQANQRILNGVAKKLKIDPEKVVSTVSQHANTSAASIPLALDVARRDGRIKDGQLVVFEAMGGGFTWGSAIVRM
ncbi:MAG: beta-ketoacyl-ACP synthase III [Alphaproteobacteria bacterium]